MGDFQIGSQETTENSVMMLTSGSQALKQCGTLFRHKKKYYRCFMANYIFSTCENT